MRVRAVLASRVRTCVERFMHTARREVLALPSTTWSGAALPGAFPGALPGRFPPPFPGGFSPWWVRPGAGAGPPCLFWLAVPSLVRSLVSLVTTWVASSPTWALPCWVPPSGGGLLSRPAFERSVWPRRLRFSHASATILLGISGPGLYNELVLTRYQRIRNMGTTEATDQRNGFSGGASGTGCNAS